MNHSKRPSPAIVAMMSPSPDRAAGGRRRPRAPASQSASIPGPPMRLGGRVFRR